MNRFVAPLMTFLAMHLILISGAIALALIN